MATEGRTVCRSTTPLREVRTRFAKTMEVAVEFLRHHALVLSVIVTDNVSPFGDREDIDGPCVIEMESHLHQQIERRVELSLDFQMLSSMPQRAIAPLN